MPANFITKFSFSLFDVIIHSDNKEIFDLVVRQFPLEQQKKKFRHASDKVMTIQLFYYKTHYSKLPRSKLDCFPGFSIFYNQFWEGECINLDVAPRTLRTIIDRQTRTITCHIATPPDFERDLLFDLIFYQPLKSLLKLERIYLFHSSCVAYKDKGILFSGQSGSGKSTLALVLAKSGFTYLADDEVVLFQEESGVQCFSFPARPKLKKESIKLFPEFQKHREKTLKKHKIFVDYQGMSSQAVQVVKPTLLIFPRFTTKSRTRLEPINKQKAISRLAKEEFMHIQFSRRNLEEEHFLALANLLRQVKVYRLYYQDKDLDKIPDMVKTLLESH